jgi:hypothetical protein
MGGKLASDLARRGALATNDRVSLSTDLIWEVEGIAHEIGRTPRQTHYLLNQGSIPAKKLGGRWCASRKVLHDFFAAKFAVEAA